MKQLTWKTTVFCGWLLSCVSLCLAQADKPKTDARVMPDFGGIWVLHETEDNRGRSNPPISAREITLIVIHQKPEIKFVSNVGEESVRESAYYTDGRGEENPSEIRYSIVGQGGESKQSNETVKSKTKWDGDKLVSRGDLRQVVSGRVVSIEIVKEWKLSKDGQMLTVTTRTRHENANRMTSGMSRRGVILRAMVDETKKVYRRSADERR